MSQANTQIAAIFGQMAEVMEILGENRFKIIAFNKAVRVLTELTQDVATLEPAQLIKIDGIGKGTAARISEFLDTGQIADHQNLIKKVPPGLLGLLDISGLGPKTIATLWRDGGVTDAASLKAKLQTGKLEKLPGLGKKTIENLKKNLAFAESATKRLRIGAALPLAQWIVEQMRKLKGVTNAAYAGSLRRGKETIGDVDILVATSKKNAEAVSDAFVKLEVVDDVLAHGLTKTSVRIGASIQVDLRVVEPDSFGAAWMYFTGSKEHNVRMRERALAMGMTLNEYALTNKKSARRVAASTEQDVYEALGLPWIAPELREDRGEILLAQNRQLPVLIERADIKADLHTHSNASDGRWSIRELVSAAMDRGFHTVAITDHSKGQAQANGLSAQRLAQHIKDIRAVAREVKGKINVLVGSEVDILVDGKLDYPDSLLRQLDIVVASPHASLAQEPAKCTRRLLKAIENRYVSILGHPTGRLINRREGLHPDMPALFKAAARRGIAMEINANHYRLDLRDTHARAAIEAGVKLSINTDAHGPADFDELRYGLLTARRAGATANDVVNTFTPTTLISWLKSTRA